MRKSYAMVRGAKADYSLKYYFVYQGLIYQRHKNTKDFISSGFKYKCVDSALRNNEIRRDNGIY